VPEANTEKTPEKNDRSRTNDGEEEKCDGNVKTQSGISQIIAMVKRSREIKCVGDRKYSRKADGGQPIRCKGKKVGKVLD
jgi:hypothetical protein